MCILGKVSEKQDTPSHLLEPNNISLSLPPPPSLNPQSLYTNENLMSLPCDTRVLGPLLLLLPQADHLRVRVQHDGVGGGAHGQEAARVAARPGRQRLPEAGRRQRPGPAAAAAAAAAAALRGDVSAGGLAGETGGGGGGCGVHFVLKFVEGEMKYRQCNRIGLEASCMCVEEDGLVVPKAYVLLFKLG